MDIGINRIGEEDRFEPVNISLRFKERDDLSVFISLLSTAKNHTNFDSRHREVSTVFRMSCKIIDKMRLEIKDRVWSSFSE